MSMPVVIESVGNSERMYDLPSKLLQNRIILLNGGVDEQMAKEAVAQLQYLDSVSDDNIRMYINSPGGSVHAGLAIADQMEQCRSKIQTVCQGYAASMGCFLLACGTPGLRFATRRAYIMAHQVSSGTGGHVMDQTISLQHTVALNQVLMGELAQMVGQDFKQFMIDCDRDKWMSAVDARDYGKNGFIDKVIGVDVGIIDDRFVGNYAKK
jgi:ATP-dependent Clp protease protease subunit